MKKHPLSYICALIIVSLILTSCVQPPPSPPAFIQNNQICLTLGLGTNAQGICTIVDMAPVKALGRDVVWFGEYEYLSPVGPPNPAVGGSWPGALVPLWGPGVPRQYVGSGATWYTVSIGPVVVGGVPVTVVKTVSLLPVATWGWAQISYQILPQADIPSLWLYYSIDYCDGPVTGSVLDNMWSFNYPPTLPLIWSEASSQQVTPLPLVTPPGGGLLVDTKGTGVGVLGSWQFPAGSTFPVTRYAGWWFNGLYDTWTNGNNLIEMDDDGALAVNLATVTTAGTVCDQLFIGELFGDPPDSPEQPPVPSANLTAAFEIEGVQPQIIEYAENHTVTKILPAVGENLTFNALLSFALNTSHVITQYSWVFGDDTSHNTTEAITTHVYEHAQPNVTASLTIYDNFGGTAHAEQTFDVTPSVGGIVELSGVEEPAAVTPDSSGHNYGAPTGIIVGAIVGTITPISAAWYIRRRRTKAT